jgi:carbamoyl-phosphate synthase large subunit
MRVLVSGVASNIGFDIGRILKEWNFFEKLYGSDISEDHPGSLIFDEVNVSPHANADNYLQWLKDYILNSKIDLLVPTSEAEILTISENLSVIEEVCKVLINDAVLINFLNSSGIKVPKHGIVGIGNKPLRYPVIIKPQRGQGRKGLRKISSDSEFLEISKGYVWQEYLEPDDQEYTCAVYVSKELKSRILLLKRVLVGGSTGKAIVVKNLEIEKYIEQIISAWNVPGLYNIQLRLTKDGPRLFEINPRVSSTVVFRDMLGFKDFKWWVLETLDMELSHYKEVRVGTKIYRGSAEYIINASEVFED